MYDPLAAYKAQKEKAVQREVPLPGKYGSPIAQLPTAHPQFKPKVAAPEMETATGFDAQQPNFFGIASLEDALFPADKEGGLLTPEEQLGMPEFERKLWGAVDKQGRPKDTLGIARFERGLWPTGWEY